jgi:hypothetical protein
MNERLNTCDLCEKSLRSPWFHVKSCRYAGLKIMADFHFRLCEACYPSIHSAIAKAVHERLKQLFLEATAKYRADWQKAVKI